MIAVDTNVLVRLLTGDDPMQEAAARSLFATEPIWIAKTVLLETGWVLRSLYGFEDSAIRDSFTKLLGLKNVHAEDILRQVLRPACDACGGVWRFRHVRQGLTCRRRSRFASASCSTDLI